MSATATNLRELHQLHERAKALRDRLTSGPKTLASRQTVLAARQATVETARKALQDAKVKLKTREHQVQSIQAKIDDLTVKLNLVKKNEEYKAIQNQILLDKSTISRIEDDSLEAMSQVEVQALDLAKLEADCKAFAAELEAMSLQFNSQSDGQKAQLDKLETALVEAENVIPEDERERYRRTVKQRGADSLAAVDNSACLGCFSTVTPQALNDLINGNILTYCKACGRILYLAEEHAHTRARR